ncbi:hypothetical protein BDY21DRAFT_354057 [Lineolata rhizophorae]|uniref:Uncharacterized protein n=1 Tax=Lineolata rhizophorae TaxID=578093 RepID=A0A6A6NRM9_9PEZI|nr:hypothetical protein BDY21DRAFT_354057 [Lineolata rhizophorae]
MVKQNRSPYYFQSGSDQAPCSVSLPSFLTRSTKATQALPGLSANPHPSPTPPTSRTQASLHTYLDSAPHPKLGPLPLFPRPIALPRFVAGILAATTVPVYLRSISTFRRATATGSVARTYKPTDIKFSLSMGERKNPLGRSCFGRREQCAVHDHVGGQIARDATGPAILRHFVLYGEGRPVHFCVHTQRPT